ncbi:MAG: 50S ribosomal protein L9 [Candidatus Aminicenantes bacterium]|jgi:large subunit ribosomal protein L9
MKVVLKENIDSLGNKGDIVDVAAGYGRNYLIPKKLALEVTASNKKMVEMEQAALKKRLEKARSSYQDVIQRLNDTSLPFVRKTAEKDVIFGSVSVADIKEELDKLGFEVEKKKILLSEPIKRLGNYTVPIKVFLDDRAEIKVQVLTEEEQKKGEEEKTVQESPEEAPDVKKRAEAGKGEPASQEDDLTVEKEEGAEDKKQEDQAPQEARVEEEEGKAGAKNEEKSEKEEKDKTSR